MKDGQGQSKRHRGSSPPFQEHEQAYHDWMEKNATSVGQDSDDNSETQAQRQQRYQEGASAGQKIDMRHSASMNVEQKYFDEVAVPQDKDDEARWQDDGGESG
jgi:hypothetical protein